MELALVPEIGDSVPSLADILLKGGIYHQSDLLQEFCKTRLCA
jgi:hypothetical protein